MFELMKIVGLSAVLSAGLVTASEVQPQPAAETVGAKIYTDRVPEGEPAPARFSKASYAAGHGNQEPGAQTSRDGKGDMLGKAQGVCSSQAWPYVAPECLGKAEGVPARSGVRVITVEQREGANTSVLVRIPASEIAQR